MFHAGRGRGVYKARTVVLMSGLMRVRDFRILHGSWRHVNHHGLGETTTTTAWVGLGVNFGKPSMEVILSCGALRTLNIIWD